VLKLIRSTDTLSIKHPAMMVYSSNPGVGRTSLAYMTRKPLLLDFDNGAHRARNRRDTAQMETWADVDELLRGDALAEFDTVIMDTVGRFLDLLTVDIIEKNSKHGKDGALSQQGWGALKTRFKITRDRLASLGKDLVMVAHGKEEKDGETTMFRPDIQGGSYGEVLKSADFVGFMYIQGKDRVLDFNPTDRWIGKNPAAWGPLKVPAYGKEPEFLSGLIDKAREALGKISEESAQAAGLIADWRAKLETECSPDDLVKAVATAKALSPAIVREQVKKLIWERAQAKGYTWEATKEAFVVKATA
jgi:hypothetical protein